MLFTVDKKQLFIAGDHGSAQFVRYGDAKIKSKC